MLASGSPRRRQLLADLGLDFTVRPPATDESPLAGESPAAMVERLARDKALARVDAGELVLAADTTVVVDGEILGKPVDDGDARRMLAALAGREHEVFTGVAAAVRGARDATPLVAARIDRTLVRMLPLSALRIADYVATGDARDKAGAYAIQGLGALLVESISGNYTNVVGLPMPTVAACVADLGIELAAFRKDRTQLSK